MLLIWFDCGGQQILILAHLTDTADAIEGIGCIVDAGSRTVLCVSQHFLLVFRVLEDVHALIFFLLQLKRGVGPRAISHSLTRFGLGSPD